jgi:UMF1 family MFS transporter
MLAIIKNDRRLLMFLIAMLLLYDTILTLQLYITSYLKTVFGFSESLVLYAGVTGLFFGIIGAALGGVIATRFSLPTKILAISAVLYALCALLFAFSFNNATFVIVLLALCGIAFGLVFSLGRTVYALIIPNESQHEYFGIFTVFERMAAVVGPLLWTATFLLTSAFGEVVQYRASVFGLAIVALLAFFILLSFHEKYGATIGRVR